MNKFDWRTVSATDCDHETLNRAVLMAAGWTVKQSGSHDMPNYTLVSPGGQGVRGAVTEQSAWTGFCHPYSPVSNSDWAAGFCLDRLGEIAGSESSAPCHLDLTSISTRAAICECVCRAYLAWRQGQEAKPE